MQHTDRYQLLYRVYKKEMESAFPEVCMEEQQFTTMLSEQLKAMSFIEIRTDTQYGFLYYHAWEDSMAHISVPVYGYYAENEKMMVRLFRKLAEETVRQTATEFSIHVYHHDQACLQALHMMQFGNMAETCINRITPGPLELCAGLCMRELNKTEIEDRWADIWHAVSQIIWHLTQSPVFYKGEEFTEEVYRAFFMDPSVHVIAAIENEKIMGIIEWNEEANAMISNSADSVNVGEVFVYPAFRGTGLSQQLLQFAVNQACQHGAGYMWVEHGTANPEARGFWNKYFWTYQYELVRCIAR